MTKGKLYGSRDICAFRFKCKQAAPPIIVGTWSMSVMLSQQFEYYYNYNIIEYKLLITK